MQFPQSYVCLLAGTNPNAVQFVGGGGGSNFPLQMCPSGTSVNTFAIETQGGYNTGVDDLGPGICAECSDGSQVCNPSSSFNGTPVPGQYGVYTASVAPDGTLTLAQGQCFGQGVETVCIPGVPTSAQTVVLQCPGTCQSIVGFSGASAAALDSLVIACG